MAKKFADLRSRMSPGARASAHAMAQEFLADMPFERSSAADQLKASIGGISMAATTEAARQRAVAQTLASWRIEGFEPDPQYLALLDRYIAGELTLAEVGSRIDESFDVQSNTAP